MEQLSLGPSETYKLVGRPTIHKETNGNVIGQVVISAVKKYKQDMRTE